MVKACESIWNLHICIYHIYTYLGKKLSTVSSLLCKSKRLLNTIVEILLLNTIVQINYK